MEATAGNGRRGPLGGSRRGASPTVPAAAAGCSSPGRRGGEAVVAGRDTAGRIPAEDM
jgi:hypothetical protein